MKWREHAPFLTVLFITSVVKLAGFTSLWSDENFYFMLAKLVSQDWVLYKDAFFMKPPLLIYGLAGFFKTFQPKIFWGNVYTYAQHLTTLALVYASGLEIEKKYGKENVALPAFLLALASSTLWRGSAETLGFTQTTFFTVLSAYFLLKDKKTLSGGFAGMALLTRHDTIILPIITLLFTKKRKEYLAGLAAPLLITLLIVSPYLGAAFQNVMASTLYSQFSNPEEILNAMTSTVHEFFVLGNAWPTLLFIASLKNWSREEFNKVVVAFTAAFLAFEFGVIRLVRLYYLAPLIPLACLFAANNFGRRGSKTFYAVTLAFIIFAAYRFAYIYYHNPRVSGDVSARQEFISFMRGRALPGDVVMGYTTFVGELSMRTGLNPPKGWANTFMHARLAGGATYEEFTSAMRDNEVRFLIDRGDEYSVLGAWPQAFGFVKQNCEALTKFENPRGDIIVWECSWHSASSV